MNLKIVSLENFSKDVKKLFKKYKNISKDLKNLQDTLLKDPKSGIELGENLYKIRLANSSIPTGKSGGFRVVYYYIDQQKNIYLMTIYSKRELENISDERLVEILKINGLG
jgi:mRNA-degrading endonuclease RelE of RelBE toxin-antitoxin system